MSRRIGADSVSFRRFAYRDGLGCHGRIVPRTAEIYNALFVRLGFVAVQLAASEIAQNGALARAALSRTKPLIARPSRLLATNFKSVVNINRLPVCLCVVLSCCWSEHRKPSFADLHPGFFADLANS